MHISVKDVVFTALKSYLLFMVSILFFPFTLVFIPAFFVELGVRKGTIENILANVILSILIAWSFQARYGIAFFLIHSLISIFMEKMIRDEMSSNRVIYFSTLGVSSFIYLTYYLLRVVNRIDAVSLIKKELQSSVVVAMELVRTARDLGISQQDISAIEEILRQTSQQILILLPVFVVIIAFLYSLISYYMAMHILYKKEVVHEKISFHSFHLSGYFALSCILSIMIIFVLKWAGISRVSELVNNLEVLFGLIFMVNGLSVIDYMCRSWHPVIRILLPTFGYLFLSLHLLYVVIGFVDAIWNLRRRSILQ